MAAEATTTVPAHPLEDGRTRCSWVAGHPEHYFFHDAEFGMVPDTDDLARERVFLCCLSRDMSLVEALDRRAELWTAFQGYDLKALAALDDAWVGGDARRAWMRDVAGAIVATAKDYKDQFRDYFLAVRFLTVDEQFADMTARFPGFTRELAASLMELLGTVEGMPHERDCWRA